ncbi:DUF6526 family protein [Epilithonimonas arachidiradicis]|uniref:Uncharacterized protein n=1 Tax=Epilithonimonas arachidiradicis TaxID=1617282 RepID=A0A420CN12_9FLAO|nr:DUF6526 family protein [Epilithonimonas arachidiradicis]RKE79776.1 hypothetical protein BXY58_3149 [Epilithonimonas arachidiradicis]GGG51855.1 hypothetical protein GCM10007332_11900 [Epilithonimonas arachidiradicis]
MSQNLKNHRKYYPLHHFVFYPVMLILLILSLFEFWDNAIDYRNISLIWLAISAIIISIVILSLMLRQHYALGLQDRIIINEFKFRYFALTGNRLENSTYQFSDAQIFALRFAEDEDLMELMHQTAQNDWSSAQIKKNIKNWKADDQRV